MTALFGVTPADCRTLPDIPASVGLRFAGEGEQTRATAVSRRETECSRADSTLYEQRRRQQNGPARLDAQPYAQKLFLLEG